MKDRATPTALGARQKWFAEAFGTDPLQPVRGGVDAGGELYFASYQALSGGNPDSGTRSATAPRSFVRRHNLCASRYFLAFRPMGFVGVHGRGG